MILINLLPHREKSGARKRRVLRRSRRLRGGPARRASGISSLAAAADLDPAGAQRVPEAEIAKLDADQGHRHAARRDRGLKARQKAVEDLQTDRNVPVHLLNDSSADAGRHLFHGIKRTAGRWSGIAQTNERVSELLRNTAYSAWLERRNWSRSRRWCAQAAQSARSGVCSSSNEFTLRVRRSAPSRRGIGASAARRPCAAAGPAKA